MITLPIRASETMKEVPIFVAIFYVDCRVIRKGDVLVKWGPMDQHLIREAIFDADDTKSPICFHWRTGGGTRVLRSIFILYSSIAIQPHITRWSIRG